MKLILIRLLLPLILFFSGITNAQVGIGTRSPDASSILDIVSTSKGILIPRLSSAQRDNILLPASGLMIYNTTLLDVELNIGTSAVPDWLGMKREQTSMIQSITQNDAISTISTTALLMPGMTLLPASGTYLALFNAQLASNESFSSSQGITNASDLYNELMAYSGGEPHALTFGSGETLPPGVYDVSGAPSIAGTLTMDGEGDPNSVFIIRGTGAFTTGIGTTVNLIGDAKAENIFWVSNAAMSTAANTTMKGTMLGGGTSAGAVSLGADSNLEGRLLTKLGAITLGANVIITVPTGITSFNLGSLASFAMWSSSGAVSDVATATTTGDAGTALGVLTITGTHNGEEYPAETKSSTSTTTYSIYKNGTEVPASSRRHNTQISTVSLQSMVTVATGDTIEIRWKIDDGEAMLNNRVLSLIRSGN